ncbi:terpene cyclase/mutase family protein [bacterium]|nr:terpene cyclase/mutase family protein [bacterium]
MSTPTAPNPADNGRPAKAPPAVIRRIGGVEETTHDRIVNRHLPAWVVSGLVHLGVIGIAFLIFGFRSPETKSTATILATTVEKEPEEVVKDLTVEDIGFEPHEASLPDIEREADKTSTGVVTDDPVGVPDATTADANALPAIGLPSLDSTVAGAVGTDGILKEGTGGAGGTASAAFLGRSGGTKSKLLKEGGGNEASEAAVAKGLAWLARQQKPGGYWEFDAADPKLKTKDWATSTGLALLPYLAAGQTHRSGGKYTKTLTDGLTWLKNDLNISTGKFAHGSPQYMYGHAIGAMALCEAYGMTKDRALLAHAQAAINYIVRAQGTDGSWGYQSGTNGDTSIVGWQIQALRAAQLTKDITVPDATVKKAVDFLNKVSSTSLKSVYGYREPTGRPGTALTAVGLLCRYYVDGWGPNNAGMAEGTVGLFGAPKADAMMTVTKTDRKRAPLDHTQVAAVLKTNPNNRSAAMPEMYYFYYATQVVHFFGGQEWQEWNEGPKDAAGKRTGGMRDWLVNVQNAGNNADAGSWSPDRGTIGSHCGRVGTTCLSLLTLEVYYRHLPLYKRNQGAAD